LRCFVGGLSVLGPGLPGWAASESALAGREPWNWAEPSAPPPALLPPTERRRAGQTTRFALAAAMEATEGEDRATLETVFASSNGDGAVVGAILDTLHEPEGMVSPTQFHNSVHNAAAGYWHIAVGSAAPSVSVGGHDGVFAAGLVAAMAAIATGSGRVLLCGYDTPMPPPLRDVRRTDFPFAAAFLLHAGPGAGARAALEMTYRAGPPPAAAVPDALDMLAEGNTAAHAVPLLRAIAARRARVLHLKLAADAHLEIRVTPC